MASDASTTISVRKKEHDIALNVRSCLQLQLGGRYVVSVGKSILYKIEVNALGKITPDTIGGPLRGQYAFQTDVLIEKADPLIPLVVLELKYRSFSTHDVITYSSKAARHKDIYPYLRYGFVVVGCEGLARRFVTHNQGFDFAMAVPDLTGGEVALVELVHRQIASAETLTRLMQSGRIKFSRYEESVHIAD